MEQMFLKSLLGAGVTRESPCYSWPQARIHLRVTQVHVLFPHQTRWSFLWLHSSCSLLQTRPGPSTQTIHLINVEQMAQLQWYYQPLQKHWLKPTKQGLLGGVLQSQFLCLRSKPKPCCPASLTKSATVIPLDPLLLACLLLKNKGETIWNVKALLDVKKKSAHLDVKYLYQDSKLPWLVALWPVQLWAARLAPRFCFLRREVGMGQRLLLIFGH